MQTSQALLCLLYVCFTWKRLNVKKLSEFLCQCWITTVEAYFNNEIYRAQTHSCGCIFLPVLCDFLLSDKSVAILHSSCGEWFVSIGFWIMPTQLLQAAIPTCTSSTNVQSGLLIHFYFAFTSDFFLNANSDDFSLSALLTPPLHSIFTVHHTVCSLLLL